MNSSVVFARMADDLVKIRTKRFWGGKILGWKDFGDLVFRWNGRGGGGVKSSPTECWTV